MIDVLCIGDLDVDMFISVSSVPGFDQKVSGQDHGLMPGGMSANSAVAVARLGLSSRLLAAVGGDDAGRFAVGAIEREGVDCDHLVHREDAKTFMCVVLLSPSGEKSLIKLETGAYLPEPEDLSDAAFADVGHLHTTFGRPTLAHKALAMATANGMSTSLDLEPPDIIRAPSALRGVLEQVDTLFLNREAYRSAGQALGEPLGTGHLRANGEIIVTLGAEGARRHHDGRIEDAPGFAVPSVDTTGAGDCFAAAYLVGRKTGLDPVDAMTFANAAAALTTLEVGSQTAMPGREAVEAFIARNRPRVAAPARAAGEYHA
ncbi:carbohydrate kinase family protein [Pelagibacterium montanilacus]|uniref:carbohydrate kinase family protein n=1 Tax=Pelagibacterium montanilacus TaxID=2185280 RepID=UPI000F8F3EB2|nr:carbohydrate kinase family protein [Pelagibacterium montanilacus]